MSRIIFIFVLVNMSFVNDIHICIPSSEKLFATVCTPAKKKTLKKICSPPHIKMLDPFNKKIRPKNKENK